MRSWPFFPLLNVSVWKRKFKRKEIRYKTKSEVKKNDHQKNLKKKKEKNITE